MREPMVAEPDSCLAQILQQAGDARAFALGIIVVNQRAAAVRQAQRIHAELGRYRFELLLQMQGELLVAQLAHELGLVFDQNELAVIDHTDAVGHLFRLLDVMRGQDDGDARCAQRLHVAPHILAQSHIDSGRGLIQKQDLRLVCQRLRDQHPPLHAARKRHDLAVLPVQQ